MLKNKMALFLNEDRMATYSVAANVFLYDAEAMNNEKENSDYNLQHEIYFDNWTKSITTLMEDNLRTIIFRKQQWDDNSNGLGLPSTDINEVLSHVYWAQKKIINFVGREELLETNIKYF
jgi:hypothetical protein